MKKICGYLLPEGKYCTLPAAYPHGENDHVHEPIFAVDVINNSRLEAACEFLHDAYESAARECGWETQTSSAKPWSEVPGANKRTMRIAVGKLIDWLETDACV